MSIFNVFKSHPNREELCNLFGIDPFKKLTKDFLIKRSKIFIENHQNIINDSIKLINETKNPDVYFKRWNTLIDISESLIIIENNYPNLFLNPKPKEQHKMLLENKDSSNKDFIDRFIEDTIKKIKSVKRIETKNNKLFDSVVIIEEYFDNFSDENKQYTEEKINYIYNEFLNGTTYIKLSHKTIEWYLDEYKL